MASGIRTSLLSWTFVAPVLALVLLVLTWCRYPPYAAVALVSVVGLAKVAQPALAAGVAAVGFPASIGLTIPAIAVASIWLPGPLVLGLSSSQIVLLAVTFVVAILTVVPGRATRQEGVVHLVLLAAFLFLAGNP